MLKNIFKIAGYNLIIVIIGISWPLYAAETLTQKTEVTHGETPSVESQQVAQALFSEVDENESFSYDFKLIAGFVAENDIYIGENYRIIEPGLAIILNLEYYNFFLESSSKKRPYSDVGNGYLGYHLWQGEESSWDLVSGTYVTPIDKSNSDEVSIPQLINLQERVEDFNVGIRYRYFNDALYFSSEAVYDVFSESHQSWIVDNYVGQVMSTGNWDLAFGVGYTWFSKGVSRYYWGVTAEETTNGIDIYEPGSGSLVSFEFSAQYPLSENWVFETGITHSYLSGEIKNSPLIVKDYQIVSYMGFGYVF